MRAFEFFAAKSSSHAVALLAEHAATAKVKIIAGGTDLLADLKFSAHGPDVVVDISRADDLKSITVTEQGLMIGALVTHSQIMRSPHDSRHVPGAGGCGAHDRRGADAQSGHAGRQSGDRRAVHGQRTDADGARGDWSRSPGPPAGGRCR